MVFYLNPGVTEEVAAIIRGQMPEGWRLRASAPNGDCTAVLRGCDFILVADRGDGGADRRRAAFAVD
jgi:hypothetical protein